jgi:co-chaperonin GroES (HSP10)
MPDMGKEKPEMGIVVSVSPIYNFNTDTEVQSKLWPGSVVMIPKMGSMKITIEQQDYFLCKETDVLGIIVNE